MRALDEAAVRWGRAEVHDSDGHSKQVTDPSSQMLAAAQQAHADAQTWVPTAGNDLGDMVTASGGIPSGTMKRFDVTLDHWRNNVLTKDHRCPPEHQPGGGGLPPEGA